MKNQIDDHVLNFVTGKKEIMSSEETKKPVLNEIE